MSGAEFTRPSEASLATAVYGPTAGLVHITAIADRWPIRESFQGQLTGWLKDHQGEIERLRRGIQAVTCLRDEVMVDRVDPAWATPSRRVDGESALQMFDFDTSRIGDISRYSTAAEVRAAKSFGVVVRAAELIDGLVLAALELNPERSSRANGIVEVLEVVRAIVNETEQFSNVTWTAWRVAYLAGRLRLDPDQFGPGFQAGLRAVDASLSSALNRSMG